MSDDLAAELLDLTATEKGYRNALYAAYDEEACSSCSSTLCCTIQLCW